VRIPLPRNKTRIAVVVGTTALLLAGAGVAWASIADSSGVIHACYASTGALRVIDSATAECKSTEKTLTWNERGPKGATGAAGPAGPAGPPGAPGVSGYVIKTDTTLLSPGMSAGRDVYCDRPDLESGLRPVGGGYHTPPDSFRADQDYPVLSADGFAGWTVFGQNISSQTITLTA